MERQVFILANEHAQQAIKNALNSLKQKTSSNRTLKSTFSELYESPIAKGSLAPSHTSLSSCQNANSTPNRTLKTNKKITKPNKTFHIRYSFSLTKPCSSKTHKHRSKTIHIENFADQLAKTTIRVALIQIKREYLSTEDHKSGSPSNYSSSHVTTECVQAITSYANRCAGSIIEQAIEKISPRNIDLFSDHLAENIINDALSTIANNSNYWEKPNTNSKTVEIHKQEEDLTDLLQLNRSTRSSTNNLSSSKDSIDDLVKSLSQELYLGSFHQLRRIFSNDNGINGHMG